MLLFLRQTFMTRARARVCVCVCVCVYVVPWHCSAQLSMFNMERRYRNKFIIIIIKAKLYEKLFCKVLLTSVNSHRWPWSNHAKALFGCVLGDQSDRKERE